MSPQVNSILPLMAVRVKLPHVSWGKFKVISYDSLGKIISDVSLGKYENFIIIFSIVDELFKR